MFRWVGKLGARNQHKGDLIYVEYTDDRRGKRCLLCGTGDMYGASIKSHFNGAIHSMNYDAVKEFEAEVNQKIQQVDLTKHLEGRISRLGLEAWKQAMKSKIFDFITNKCLGTDIVSEIEKFQNMERLSLLELAIWKSRTCDGLVFASVEQMREYVILDESFDVKTYMGQLRVANGCHIIIPRVKEFL